MKIVWTLLIVSLVGLTVLVLYWLGQDPQDQTVRPPGDGSTATASGPAPIRIALVPERDIFAQAKRYKALGKYIEGHLGQGVEIVTVNTYGAVLKELEERRIDAAFLGSLVTVLAYDRVGARPCINPEYPGGANEYRGVLIVKDDSPIKSVADLSGRSVAMVRTTMAGSLYAAWLLGREGLLDSANPPRFVLAGTHDDVVAEVVAGRVDAGSTKDLRLEAVLRSNPQWKIRRLATGEAAPENALVVRADRCADLAPKLTELLLNMDRDEAGRKMLAEFGAARFVPCGIERYGTIYDMVGQLGDKWDRVGPAGPPPRRQTAATITATAPAGGR